MLPLEGQSVSVVGPLVDHEEGPGACSVAPGAFLGVAASCPEEASLVLEGQEAFHPLGEEAETSLEASLALERSDLEGLLQKV